MTIREDQKEKRRQEILYAGLSLFIQKGYSGTTIKDIAQAVGMSAGLLFHYFASKEELYSELVTLGMEGPMSSLQPTTQEPLAFFAATAERILSYIQTQPFVAKMFVLMHQAYYSDDVPASVKERLAGFDVYTPTAQILRQGQQNGTIRAGDPVALSIAYWSAIQGVAETLAMHSHLPCPKSEWITDILRAKQDEK
ncbi:MAG TPA: TetR/AcrR family transcriptional regulator [Clostridia bacterium]|nr:TetR/AcrR family transcriptional regulator [Clostridia bacterium]